MMRRAGKNDCSALRTLYPAVMHHRPTRTNLALAALLSLVTTALLTAPLASDESNFSDEEREVSLELCVDALWANIANDPKIKKKDAATRDKFCNCVVEGWEEKFTFAKLMRTIFRSGSGKIAQDHPDALMIAEPTAVCAVRSGLHVDNANKQPAAP